MATRKMIRNIPDDVFREAKAIAARQDKPLGQYIAEALKEKNKKEVSK